MSYSAQIERDYGKIPSRGWTSERAEHRRFIGSARRNFRHLYYPSRWQLSPAFICWVKRFATASEFCESMADVGFGVEGTHTVRGMLNERLRRQC